VTVGIQVERTDFVSLPVTDLERSTAFYRDTVGLPQIGFGGWPEFQLGENVSLYLLDPTNIGQEFRGPHTSTIALRVPDVEEARQVLEAKGVAFAGETFDTGVCHMAIFHDPDGNALMLHRRYAPQASGTAA
jgi:catechol 2,3-dioxygenase-like lactoylglutathione lyase family enzyme